MTVNELYVLMHKNKPIAEITMDHATCTISKINRIENQHHAPIGTMIKNTIDRGLLNDWWKGRSIPASRAGIKDVLEKLNFSSSDRLLEKSLGLSLTDQYWIKPKNSELNWSKVNFFENDFSEDVGNILFGADLDNEKINFMSPDNTSDGWLKKKWKIIEGKRCLIKSGSPIIYQEVYNEVFTSIVCEALNIPHIPYKLMMIDEYPYSVCENFVTPNTELVSAWYVMQTPKKENHVSVYHHYINCCKKLGIMDIEKAVDQMIVLDFLMMNADRHQNNFGVLRNAETLEWIGVAPIFDTGSSLCYDQPTSRINADTKVSCKPFKNNHKEQLKLVTSFEFVDFAILSSLQDKFYEVVQNSEFVDNNRMDKIYRAFLNRVNMLREFMLSKYNSFESASTENDVMNDVKYSLDEDLER